MGEYVTQEYTAITILLEPRTIGIAQVLFNSVSLGLWLDRFWGHIHSQSHRSQFCYDFFQFFFCMWFHKIFCWNLWKAMIKAVQQLSIAAYQITANVLSHSFWGRGWQSPGSSAQGPTRLQSRCLLGCILIWGPVGGRLSASKLMQIPGRIHCLAVVGLRAPASCWLLPGKCAQFLTAALNFFSPQPPQHGHLLHRASRQSL